MFVSRFKECTQLPQGPRVAGTILGHGQKANHVIDERVDCGQHNDSLVQVLVVPSIGEDQQNPKL